MGWIHFIHTVGCKLDKGYTSDLEMKPTNLEPWKNSNGKGKLEYASKHPPYINAMCLAEWYIYMFLAHFLQPLGHSLSQLST